MLVLTNVCQSDVSLYAPTPFPAVVAMLELAEVTKDDVLYDLGCGDGRILILASRISGCHAVGIEKSRIRAEQARRNIHKNGAEDTCRVLADDLLADETEFQDATVVTMYLLEDVSRPLLPKLERLRKGTRIVCYAEPLPGIKPTKTKKVGKALIYLYTVPLEKECKT